MVVQPDRIRCGVGTSGAGGLMSEHGLSGFSMDAFVGIKGVGFTLVLHLSVIPAFLRVPCIVAALGTPVPGPWAQLTL